MEFTRLSLPRVKPRHRSSDVINHHKNIPLKPSKSQRKSVEYTENSSRDDRIALKSCLKGNPSSDKQVIFKWGNQVSQINSGQITSSISTNAETLENAIYAHFKAESQEPLQKVIKSGSNLRKESNNTLAVHITPRQQIIKDQLRLAKRSRFKSDNTKHNLLQPENDKNPQMIEVGRKWSPSTFAKTDIEISKVLAHNRRKRIRMNYAKTLSH